MFYLVRLYSISLWYVPSSNVRPFLFGALYREVFQKQRSPESFSIHFSQMHFRNAQLPRWKTLELTISYPVTSSAIRS